MQTVLFDQLPAAQGTQIGLITLNQPKQLNGLSLEMAQAIYSQLQVWRDDDRICLVLMRGQGEKSFCAGGDLQMFYRHLPEAGQPVWASTYLRDFFRVEYQLDFAIHTFPKPVICWANGYVMGGGAGLMMGCSHRVATETTRFAMPEISIGVVPDVGATWFLNRLPESLGRVLAMTGISVEAQDCAFLGLTNYKISSIQWQNLLGQLQQQKWAGKREQDDLLLDHLLASMAPESVPRAGPLQRHTDLIRQTCSGPDFLSIYYRLLEWEKAQDLWLRQAADRLRQGSPGSVRLAFEMLRQGRHYGLADAFRLEYIVALNCAGNADLREGIRALLIDKDRSPCWAPATAEQANTRFAAPYFQPPWPGGQAHPLQLL